MADLRPQFSEEVVGANHPTKTDVTNRAWDIEHDEDGTHKNNVIKKENINADVVGTGLAGGAGTALSVDGIVEVGASAELKVKVINIGDWNMDTTVNVSVAHGLSLANIRAVTVLIRNDDGSGFYPLDKAEGDFADVSGIFDMASVPGNVNLYRFTTGFFDAALFDSTSYNRGWITIWYVV